MELKKNTLFGNLVWKFMQLNKYITGSKIYSLAEKLWPIDRSITGPGVRKTLAYIKEIIPDLKIKFFKSGTKVFDWTIPPEWFVNDAYISDDYGKKIIDFKKNNLHLIGYSYSIRKRIHFNELKKNLYYLKEFPDAIPYITSYYNKIWGFCISYNDFLKLNNRSFYQVVIDTSFKKNGVMNYGEFVIKGKSKKEIIFSTYICHPSLANNELSGPCLATFLIQWAQKNILNPHYTYRFIFIPETIGSIAYIHKNIEKLKKNVIAGFVITCVGDDKNWSLVTSRYENKLCDHFAIKCFKKLSIDYKKYSYLERGSDERQYCFPSIDLPFCSVTRSKYNTYKEYHTSNDNLSFISSKGFEESFNYYKSLIMLIDKSRIPLITTKCEPFLSKRNLRNTLSQVGSGKSTKNLMDILNYCDGNNTDSQIASITSLSLKNVRNNLKILEMNRLIKYL